MGGPCARVIKYERVYVTPEERGLRGQKDMCAACFNLFGNFMVV